jgi:uncharacterized damage-inducible protein DinB
MMKTLTTVGFWSREGKPVNQRHARCMRSSSTSLRSLVRSWRRSMTLFGTGRSLTRNNQGKDYVETAHVACSHLFNHQTHHRGQVHVMLSQTPVVPPSLDLHRIVNF